MTADPTPAATLSAEGLAAIEALRGAVTAMWSEAKARRDAYGGVSEHARDLVQWADTVSDATDALVARVRALEADVARVLRLTADVDGNEWAHRHRIGEGEPECPGCWVQDILAALDAGSVSR